MNPSEAQNLPYRVESQTHVRLRVEVLGIGPDRPATAIASRELDLHPDDPGRVEVELPWPSGEDPRLLRLAARGTAGVEPDTHLVTVRSVITDTEGARVEAEREFRMREGSSYLMEAFRRRRTAIVLSLTAEAVTRPVLVQEPRVVGTPVVFRLEVERVQGDRSVLLETNRLQTFLGEAVEYSFDRGAGEQAESVRLRLRPVRVEGDLAEVELVVSASLPGEPDRLVLSRREQLLTTRGATSSLTAATGQPASGYRFRITPRF